MKFRLPFLTGFGLLAATALILPGVAAQAEPGAQPLERIEQPIVHTERNGLVAGAEQAQSDQGRARQQLMAGEVRPLREIEQRVVPQMSGMRYLGPEYDAASQVYRLRFIDGGQVVFVDVDARTGRILRQTR